MTRMATGLCVAAALSVATLGAQTPSSTTTGQRTASADAAKEVTLTGCLSKGADGKYILNNAKLDNPAGATAGTSGSATASGGTTAAASGSAGMNAASSWTLSGGTDLDKHVGHKIQVTGRAAMNPAMDHGGAPDTTAAAGGTATGSTATGATGAGTVGTSGSTATAATEEQRKDMKTNQPRLDVQSVKMIAATCS